MSFYARSNFYTHRDAMNHFNSVAPIPYPAQEVSRSYMILQTVVMSLIIAVTGTGNALVILSFLVDKTLRTHSNLFLLNLATCDLFIGVFSLPLYLKNYIINGKWVLGRTVCKLWLTIDYLVGQSSIYNIVLISFDRFESVTKAATYRAQQSQTKPAVIKMAIVWLLAFLLYGPAIIFWEYITGYSNFPDGDCNPEFFYMRYFRLCSSVFEFFLPLAAILYFNVSIYCNIKDRTKRFLQKAPRTCSNTSHVNREQVSFSIHIAPANVPENNGSPFTKELCKECHLPGEQNDQHSSDSTTTSRSSGSRSVFFTKSRENIPTAHQIENRQIAKLSKDKKIAKSLVIIVCTFCVCWAPYPSLMVIRDICSHHCIPSVWHDVTCWFLWMNSSVNPFLYPLCHPAFKKAFVKILCRTLSRQKRSPRNVHY